MTEKFFRKKNFFETFLKNTRFATLFLFENKNHKPNNNEKYTILDAGCGNALLGYFLSRLGFNYLGIDVQRRKIWTVLEKLASETRKNSGAVPSPGNKKTERNQQSPGTFILQEKAIESENFLETYQDKNISMILGNHSDELTVWIPVLSKQLGTDFMIIPCCDFDLSGKKFDRNQPEFSRGYQSHDCAHAIDRKM